MTTQQQQEALEYFRKHAGAWRAKADSPGHVSVNIIEQRNAYVLQVAAERPAMRAFLDVGCGTGELVCAMARREVDAQGVDYAPEMIDLASAKARAEGLTRATFTCRSIFDVALPPGRCDLISANGFIEYIAYEEMLAFFDLVAGALAPGGSFVVGSRNRLFNLVSMNGYTRSELEAGAVELLLAEAVQWSTAATLADVVDAPRAPVQAPDTRHGNTGIGVTTRFQYSPLQLIDVLQARGLRPVEVYPVHIHGVPPGFKQAHAEVHAVIANALQAHARHNTQLLSQASTFMLHVTAGA